MISCLVSILGFSLIQILRYREYHTFKGLSWKLMVSHYRHSRNPSPETDQGAHHIDAPSPYPNLWACVQYFVADVNNFTLRYSDPGPSHSHSIFSHLLWVWYIQRSVTCSINDFTLRNRPHSPSSDTGYRMNTPSPDPTQNSWVYVQWSVTGINDFPFSAEPSTHPPTIFTHFLWVISSMICHGYLMISRLGFRRMISHPQTLTIVWIHKAHIRLRELWVCFQRSVTDIHASA